MNLALSKRGDYVVRSAICLARAFPSGEIRKIRQVVAEMGVPKTFASQILADLVKAGLANSKAGKEGGYRLARAPELVSLLEVVEAGEGSLWPERCAMEDGPCRWDSVCPLHETWGAAAAALRDVLAATTLSELASRDVALDAGTYDVPENAHRKASAGIPVLESTVVPVEIDALRAELAGGLGWAGAAAEQAFEEGEELRLRIGPSGQTWLGKSVVVSVGAALERDGEVVVPISWEATGARGLFPKLEARLVARAHGIDRCELVLEGRYKPPLGRAGQLLDEALFGRLARATVRSFLQRSARAIGGEAAVVGMRIADAEEAGERSGGATAGGGGRVVRGTSDEGGPGPVVILPAAT